MLNRAAGDRDILAKKLGISLYQISYVSGSGPGEGLMFYVNVIIPFSDKFSKDTETYRMQMLNRETSTRAEGSIRSVVQKLKYTVHLQFDCFDKNI